MKPIYLVFSIVDLSKTEMQKLGNDSVNAKNMVANLNDITY